MINNDEDTFFSMDDGPYVLDIIVPYTEHVLPMIPAGKTVKDMILK